MSKFHVTERFVSINGEARRAGELACFIRLAGCNLHCNYCDTRWSCVPDAPGEQLTEDELYDWVRASGVKNVTLTGGEPLLAVDVHRLIRRLAEDDRLRIEIETNGSVALDPFLDIPGEISFTMDMKCPGSGMAEYGIRRNLSLLRPTDTVKYVVSDTADLDWMREQVEEEHLTGKCAVYISPVFGRIDPKGIVEYMRLHEMNDIKLQLQLHKFIWAPTQRGV